MTITTTTSLIICITISIAGLFAVNADHDTMLIRPIRPKTFNSVDDLRKYLDLVQYYYSLTGKARYGKRTAKFVDEIYNPDYVRHGNLFTESIDDDGDNMAELQQIFKQLSDPVIPGWLNKLKKPSHNYEELQESQYN